MGKIRIRAIYVLFCVCFFVFVTGCGNENEESGYLIYEDRTVEFEISDKALISDGIHITSNYIIVDGNFFDLVTIVLNDSGVNLRNIHLEFELYNAEGERISTKEDNTGLILQGNSFRSSVPISFRRDVALIKITKATAR